jgi:hypothetical protein
MRNCYQNRAGYHFPQIYVNFTYVNCTDDNHEKMVLNLINHYKERSVL